MKECVKPKPGQPRWNCAGSRRLQVPRAEVDPVDEPLGHHVRRVRADQQRHEGELQPGVLLDRVRLEVVRRPAQSKPPDERRHGPGGHDQVGQADPEREQEVDPGHADRDVDRGREAVAAEHAQVAPVRDVEAQSQSHVRWPRRMRRPQLAQKFSARRAARCTRGQVSSAPKARAPRIAASSGSITSWRLNRPQRRVGRCCSFGLVGTGYWADVAHAAGIAAHPDAELVGVWGRDPAKASALAAKHGVRAFDDLDELIAAVDAVAFSVPPDVQAELAPAGGRGGQGAAAREAAGAERRGGRAARGRGARPDSRLLHLPARPGPRRLVPGGGGRSQLGRRERALPRLDLRAGQPVRPLALAARAGQRSGTSGRTRFRAAAGAGEGRAGRGGAWAARRGAPGAHATSPAPPAALR